MGNFTISEGSDALFPMFLIHDCSCPDAIQLNTDLQFRAINLAKILILRFSQIIKQLHFLNQEVGFLQFLAIPESQKA